MTRLGVGLALLLVVALAVLGARPAQAHTASDGYLTLRLGDGPTFEGAWDLALIDLDNALKLRADAAGKLGPAEVRAQEGAIEAFALGHLGVATDGAPCALAPGPGPVAFTEHADAVYVTIPFTAQCSAAAEVVAIDYTLFFDRDPQHRGLARIEDGGSVRSVIFSSHFRHEELVRRGPARRRGLGPAFQDGLAHIGTGTDHLLFLLVLLLPAVLRRRDGVLEPVERFRDAAVEVAKVVTAFTLAHSVTLSLAVLGVVRLPPRFVEPAIAASIVVAAVLNLTRGPRSGVARWPFAFALGLLHGFGFSAALVDLGLRRVDLVSVLLGFNLGVEAGQLAAVGLFLPVAYALRRWRRYRAVVLRGGSAVVGCVATVWLVQRVAAPPVAPPPAPVEPRQSSMSITVPSRTQAAMRSISSSWTAMHPAVQSSPRRRALAPSHLCPCGVPWMPMSPPIVASAGSSPDAFRARNRARSSAFG
jgi:hypothetical protein